MRVLVFPSCNEPGLEVVDALRLHPRITVFGGSSFDLLADPSRLVLGENHLHLPALGDADFRGAFTAICGRLEIDLVFPTVDALVAELCGWTETPFRVVGPSAELAELVLSKSRVYAAVGDAVPVPRPFDPATMGLPAFAKPDIGSGSRGARTIDTGDALRRAVAEGLLVQEQLPGDEYTVDCVGAPDGRLLARSVRRRLAYGAGIAKASTCVDHPELEARVEAIAERLPLAGPWFAQFKEDADGTPRLMEVNARAGGSSGVTRLAGVNLPLMAALAFTGVDVVAPRRTAPLTVVRRLDRRGDVDDFDLVVWDLDDTLVHAGEVVDADMVGWLYRFAQQGRRQALVTRNPDPAGMLARTRLPDFFERVVSTEDKVAVVRALVDELDVDPARTVMINDSGAEKLLFERELPAVRTIAPDAIGALRG